MTKQKQRKRLPYFGGGILTDNFALADTGKVNAYGIYTMFWAWDFPCHRRGVAIFTLFDLPKRKTKVTVSIKKKGSKAKKLSSLIVQLKEDAPPLIQTIALRLTLPSAGSYQLLFSIYGISSKLRIPFEVRKKDWPEFTKAEREFVKTNPMVAKSIRANVHCSQCSHAYVFEESLLETPPDKGVQRFPDSGKFKCLSCSRQLRLRDLQGQLRASLKEQVKEVMKRQV